MNPQIAAGQMRYGFLPHWPVGSLVPTQLPAQPAGNAAPVGAASTGPMKSGKAPAAPAAAPGATYIHTNLVPNLKFPTTLIFSQPTGLQMMTQVSQSTGGAPGRPGDNNAPQPQVIGGPFMATRPNVFQTPGGPRVSVITVPQQQQPETQGPTVGTQPQHSNPKGLHGTSQQTVDQKLRAVSKPAPVQPIGANARRQPRRGAAPGSDTTSAAPGRQPRGPLARSTTADLTGASRLLAAGLRTRPATTIGFNNGKPETKAARNGSQPSGQAIRTDGNSRAPQRQTSYRKVNKPRARGPSRRGRGKGSSGSIGGSGNNGGAQATKNGGGKSTTSRPSRAKKSRWQVKTPAAAPGPSS